MTKDFRDQLLRGTWNDLKDHLERGAIIVVDPNLDISEVAASVAKDEAAQVQAWIHSGQLVRPTGGQIQAWNGSPTKEFQFLITQPYVLIQELSH